MKPPPIEGAARFRVWKAFEFSASHVLDHLPADHPCSRLHGHNYAVEIEIEGVLDDRGFVVDYRDLAPLKAYIDEHLDHRHLNEWTENYGATNPSAECLAWLLFQTARDVLADVDGFGSWWDVAACRVRETPKTCAEYRGER